MGHLTRFLKRLNDAIPWNKILNLFVRMWVFVWAFSITTAFVQTNWNSETNPYTPAWGYLAILTVPIAIYFLTLIVQAIRVVSSKTRSLWKETA